MCADDVCLDMQGIESKHVRKDTPQKQLELRVAGVEHVLQVFSVVRVCYEQLCAGSFMCSQVRLTARTNHVPVQPYATVLWDQTALLHAQSTPTTAE